MTKHTDLYIGHDQDEKGCFYYIGPENRIMAILPYDINIDADEVLNFARFIVKSCNSHYDLVEALERIADGDHVVKNDYKAAFEWVQAIAKDALIDTKAKEEV